MYTEYENLVLVRLGEIVLKGLNRHKFIQQLIRNLRYRLRESGSYTILQDQSRVWISAQNPDTDFDSDRVLKQIQDVFGYVSASPVRRFDCDPEILEAQVRQYVNELFADGRKHSFKFETRRINKHFPIKSYDLNCRLGELVLTEYPEQATVDVRNPEFELKIEIRDSIYLYHRIQPAYKGLPVGMSGKGLLLLSGGIDSPVAGFQMASRGMELEAIYFHTFPYTGDQAKEKVIDLARELRRFCGRLRLHIVDFTEIQLTLNQAVPDPMMTVVMRRMMMRIADRLADQRQIKCLITGESLGQVASQTLEALAATDLVATRPVFRPLIGIDKDDTVRIARRIGTFETSILPYEDCCTVFVAKHPKTHPSLADAEKAESGLAIEDLTCKGLAGIDTIEIK